MLTTMERFTFTLMPHDIIQPFAALLFFLRGLGVILFFAIPSFLSLFFFSQAILYYIIFLAKILAKSIIGQFLICNFWVSINITQPFFASFFFLLGRDLLFFFLWQFFPLFF
jgi:hypothetical protein